MSSSAHKPLVYIISAPSGSGKSTLVNELLKSVSNLEFSISYTTRAPRGSELDGKQYYFVSRAEFETMLRNNQFLEHAEVHDNHYGTARRFLEDAERNGRDLVLDIDVQGSAQIQRKLSHAISIFILPPNRKTLEERLRNRSEDSDTVIQRRLLMASQEIQDYSRYKYILVNNLLEESSEELKAIVRSERLLRSGQAPSNKEAKMLAVAEACRLASVRERLRPILDSFRLSGDCGVGSPS